MLGDTVPRHKHLALCTPTHLPHRAYDIIRSNLREKTEKRERCCVPYELMCVYHYTQWEDLRALYHLPELLKKNNALSVILIMAMVSESKGISCWRVQRIYRPRGGLGWLKIYKMFHWLPLTALQYWKYRVMGLRSSVISENMELWKECQLAKQRAEA